MKAMRLHQPAQVEQSPLRLERVADPTPGPGDLILQVHCCGVCRTDLHIAEGELPARHSPLIPGHEVVGRVVSRGSGTEGFAIGDRAGVAWLHSACGECGFCRRERENLCEDPALTGWTVDGGYAELTKVPAAFAYRIPDGFADEQAAPLLCAGIIGYRSLRLCGIQPGERLGLYGFGAAAHIAIQVARHWGCAVYVSTRGAANRELARALGAQWVGGSRDRPPEKLHASIIFAPAGELAPHALRSLEKGGTVALAGIHMSDIPSMDYREHLYHERILRSVTNATRADGRELLALASKIPLRMQTTSFPLSAANEALVALKHGRFTGAAVLDCRGD